MYASDSKLFSCISNMVKISGPNKSAKITDHYTCISVNVIYCVTCTPCKKIYIGETWRRLAVHKLLSKQLFNAALKWRNSSLQRRLIHCICNRGVFEQVEVKELKHWFEGVRKKKFFAGLRSVRIVKNSDLNLENRSPFSTIRTSQPACANNIYTYYKCKLLWKRTW